MKQYDIEKVRDYINNVLNKKIDEYLQETKKNVIELEKLISVNAQLHLLNDIYTHLCNVIQGKEEL